MIKKEDFYFDSRDGEHQIHAVKWVPDAEKPVCIVQIVHGMAEYIDRYDDFANYLAKRDILVVGDDHLGHGRSVKPGETYGYFCKEDAPTVLVRDEHRLKKIMQKKYADVPYIILGHSMGSFITRNYLLKYGAGVNGAIIVGTGMQPKAGLLCGIAVTTIEGMIFGADHVSKFTNIVSFGAYNKRIPSPKTPVDWLSRDEDNVRKYVKDPMCGFVFTANGFQTLFKLIYNLHNRERLMKMPKNLPVIFLAGSEDPVGDYGRTVKQVYESFKELGMQNVQIKLYPKDRHELLNEVDKEDVYGDVYRWILQRI